MEVLESDRVIKVTGMPHTTIIVKSVNDIHLQTKLILYMILYNKLF